MSLVELSTFNVKTLPSRMNMNKTNIFSMKFSGIFLFLIVNVYQPKFETSIPFTKPFFARTAFGQTTKSKSTLSCIVLQFQWLWSQQRVGVNKIDTTR